MNNVLLTFLIIFSLVLCSCQNIERSESEFYRDFNIGRTVGKMNVGQLRPKSSGQSVSTSITETTDRRRETNVEFSIDNTTHTTFDNRVFLEDLRASITAQLSNSEITSVSGGTAEESFYFNYAIDHTIQGSVEVIGTVVEGDRYKLWCIVRERVGDDLSE